MNGMHVPEHVVVQLEPREADTLRKVLLEVQADNEFPLNELEDEVVYELVEILEP